MESKVFGDGVVTIAYKDGEFTLYYGQSQIPIDICDITIGNGKLILKSRSSDDKEVLLRNIPQGNFITLY